MEAKAVSAFTGWPIKPENINKLLVEIKEHFIWEDDSTIPLLGLKLSSSLVPDRTRLQQLVSALSKVAQTREELSLSDAHVRFIGAIPSLTPDKLQKTTYRHAQMAKKIVLFSTTDPKIVLELDSHRPIQLERKIIRTISETAREQFSRLNPGVIWTHINFIPNEVFTRLSSSQGGNACFLDRIAGSALLSEKRNHLSQLIFSGGSFLDKIASTARSSYGQTLYDSPVCRFGKNVIFQGGRRKPSLALGTA